MFRKSVFIMLFVCLLATCQNVWAWPWDGQIEYQAGGADGDWCNPANWNTEGGIPCPAGGPNNLTYCAVLPNQPGPRIGGAGCIDAHASMLAMNPWDPTPWGGQDVNVTILPTAGDVNFSCALQINSMTDYDSRLGGTTLVSRAIVNQYGGTVRTPQPGGQGFYGLTVGGGGSTLGNSYGMYNLYDGLANFPRIRLYFGEINIYGGTMQATDGNFVFTQNHSENRINVNGGTLKIAGNWLTSDPNLPGLINAGRIVCMRGGTLGTPTYDAGAVLDPCYPALGATILTGTVDFNLAWNPIPANNSGTAHYYHADGNYITLTWNRGEPNVVQHDVYFGTSSGSLTLQHSFTDANMGDPCSWTISGFNFVKGASYYWRVDETQQTGDTFAVKTGQVWTFKTYDGKAYNPIPTNRAPALSEPLQLSWTPSEFAAYHNVFFGTTSANANGAGTTATDGRYRGSVSSPAYPLVRLLEKGANLPGASYTLIPGVTYYWRVDEVNGTSVVKGDVWNFTPAGYVNIDDFEDYNTTIDMNSIWKTVYDNNCPSAGGHMDLTPGSISLITSSIGKYMRYTYINSGGRGIYYSEIKRPYTGGTSFTGGGVLVPAVAALRIDYLGATQNSVDPDFDRMYIAIEDTEGNVAVYLNPDPSASAVTSWTQWFAALKDINAMGMPKPVRLADVNGFCIGFGKRCLTSIGDEPPFPGDGNVMFDTIRLYASTCNAGFAHTAGLTADLDNDCDVDINDMDAFANEWLAHAEDRTFAVSQPAAPVLWFKFNETGVQSIAQDSGTGDANNYDGTVVGWSAINWKPLGRDGNGCLYLPPGGGNYVDVNRASLGFLYDGLHDITGGGGLSFSVWINADTGSNMRTSWNGLFGTWDAGVVVETLELHCPAPVSPPACNFIKRTPSITASTGGIPLGNFSGKWNHWAFTKEPLSMKVYCNGNLVAHADTNGIAGDPNINEYGPLFDKAVGSFRIGTRGGNWGMWNGYMDDFKVYDYCLSPAEVSYLATDGTGAVFLPLVSNANLKSSGNAHTETIDFKDLAVMCQQWHTQVLYP